MCFTTNGTLAENQLSMYRKLETVLRNQWNFVERIKKLETEQKIISDKLDKVLEILTNQHEDKGE